MKKNLLRNLGVFACIFVLFSGCGKKDYETPCRLTVWAGLDDGYNRSLHYNQWGLVDKWDEIQPASGLDQFYTIFYSDKKKLTKMKFYDHGDLLYTILFEYKGGKIVKENWYVGNTKTLDDIVENKYNSKGLLYIRNSLYYKFYSKFWYDNIGNNTKCDVVDTESGLPFVRSLEDHRLPVREPNTTIEGLPYPIPFANQVTSPLIYTDYKFYVDNGNGLELVFDVDYVKGSIKAGKDRLAISHLTFDNISKESNQQIFKYENCNCEVDNVKSSKTSGGFSKTSKAALKPNLSLVEMRKLVTQLRKK